MTPRPPGVTVIGWFSKGGGILGMITALPYSRFAPELLGEYWAGPLARIAPAPLFVLTFLSSFACILMGHGVLGGRQWSRVAILAYCVVGTLVGAILLRGHPLLWFNAITSVAFTLFIGVLLFRPDADEYFRNDITPDPASTPGFGG